MNLQILDQLLQNEPQFRQKQVYQAIFDRLLNDWEQATNLSKQLRDQLQQQFPLTLNSHIFSSKIDRTIKALITFEDNLAIETVLMRSQRGRNTVCVSTQIGCPLECSFCATGNMGLKRNLTDWEIATQVLLFARLLKKENDTINNVVFMGMGEPFLNYDNVLQSIKVLNNKDGLRLGARKFSISTCGITEGIDRLANEPLEINLAISLHAPNDQLRSKIMKINNQYPINKILSSVNIYIAKTNRKVMFEYLLLKGVNDSVENARQLAKLMNHKLYMVNLIRYNPTQGFMASNQMTIDQFKKILEKEGIEVTQRYSFGQDIQAACGQLAINS